jgi:transcription antitermination factor NusG
MAASVDVNAHEECCIGLTTSALPEIQKPFDSGSSKKGVSTKYVHSSKLPHWYALRTTYGREKKAYDFIVENGGTAFYPTIKVYKLVNGKKRSVTVSRIPNVFFAYGTEEEIQSFVYDNVNLPYLRFYYNYHRDGSIITKEPLIVPDNQIESLRIICKSEVEDIIVSANEISKFKSGQVVRVIDGKFRGVTGIVARYQGQQRVGIVIDGLLTVVTAYIPSAFLKLCN